MQLSSNLCAMYYQMGKICSIVLIISACTLGTYEEDQKCSVLSSPKKE